ncbi:MAG: hypothetical protein ACKV19_16510 [Verrucomicrobiales bacterium]
MTPAPDPPLERSTKIRWGFVVVGTLVGLLVLLSVTPPAIRRPGINAAITASAMQANGLHKALMLYAHDHDGRFPEAMTNSNEAYRQLFPDYLQEERPFYVPRSAWHAAARGQKSDNDIGSPPAFEEALEKGENYWAYVSGLGTQSDSQLPVIADGFVEGSPGTYTDDPSQKGGVWKGTKAIVVLVSGATRAEPLSKSTGFRVWRRDPTTGTKVHIFQLPPPPEGAPPRNALNPL